MEIYGKELILDLRDCNTPFNREEIENYMKELCSLIDMKREDLHFWDYEGDPEGYKKAPSHLKGISAVQFIKTSNITIHVLDDLGKVFLNIFSCKLFDVEEAKEFSKKWFGGRISHLWEISRV